MTHQHCPRFIMVTMGMVVGMVSLEATRKRMSPVRSRILPSPILPLEWHRWKIHTHWMTFWWWGCSLSEGLRPTPVGRVESECSSAFRPRETPLLSVSDELLQCLHHASWCNQHSVISTLIKCDMTQWKKREAFLRRSSKHLVFGAV